jgi:hypothetical protein
MSKGDNCADTTPINSADPKFHSQHIQEMLRDVIDNVRRDLDKVNEPRFQALLETTAEVLTGLQTTFTHYSQGNKKAWKRQEEAYTLGRADPLGGPARSRLSGGYDASLEGSILM